MIEELKFESIVTRIRTQIATRIDKIKGSNDGSFVGTKSQCVIKRAENFQIILLHIELKFWCENKNF